MKMKGAIVGVEDAVVVEDLAVGVVEGLVEEEAGKVPHHTMFIYSLSSFPARMIITHVMKFAKPQKIQCVPMVTLDWNFLHIDNVTNVVFKYILWCGPTFRLSIKVYTVITIVVLN